MTRAQLVASRASARREERKHHARWQHWARLRDRSRRGSDRRERLQARVDTHRREYVEARALVDRRTRQIAAKKPARSRRDECVHYAASFAGHTTEQPAGSNGGPRISQWEARLGFGRVPWCGIFCGNMLLHVGVKGVSSRIASVALIEDDARAHRAPFRGWTTSPGQVLPGDLVVLFGRGVHVEMVRYIKAGVVYTVGGNTSPGTGGSQANGGGVFLRARPMSAVHGFALVNFPG